MLRSEIEAIQDGIREPSARNLSSLHAEILRLARLVDDLHQLAAAESNHLFLNRRRLSPLGILEGLVDAYRDRFDRLYRVDPSRSRYICKPFSPREVVARVKAVLRRTHPRQPSFRLVTGPIILDEASHEVTIDSHVKNLRKKIAQRLPGREVIVTIYGVGYKLNV